MLKLLIFIIAFWLNACTSLPKVQQLPVQAQPLRTFKVEHNQQASLLTVQFEKTQWRWIQTDPLGSPQARVLLTKNGWSNDGFVIPNRQAQLLFMALANIMNQAQPPFQLDERWKIEKFNENQSYFLITLPDETEWKVKELGDK